MLISFDPNLRPPLWKSLDDAKEATLKGLSYCDYLKISDNEIEWLTETKDYDEAVNRIRHRFPNIKLITVSLGPEGSRAYYRDIKIHVDAFLNETVVDTTGAGDTFGGDNLDESLLRSILLFSNAAASIVTTRKGALRVMPTIREVEKVLNL